MHRFSATLTIQKNGTAIHVETILPSAGGCGIVYHPDGTLYLNMNDGVHGVANVNPATGALIRYLGTPGNAVGIAVDPVSNHIVYADKNCVSTVKAPNKCSLLDLDTVSGVVTTRATFPITSVAFVNGIYFDPTGAYMFLSNRFAAAADGHGADERRHHRPEPRHGRIGSGRASASTRCRRNSSSPTTPTAR